MCKLVDVFKDTDLDIYCGVDDNNEEPERKKKNLGNFKNEELFYTFTGILSVFETV